MCVITMQRRNSLKVPVIGAFTLDALDLCPLLNFINGHVAMSIGPLEPFWFREWFRFGLPP